MSLSNCPQIIVTIRDKRDMSAEARLQRLLHGALFNLVRDDKVLLAKVTYVKADLKLPKLGLSAADAALLQQQVTPAN